MAGVGTNGGYAPWLNGAPYPPGPPSWPAGQSWPLNANGSSQLNAQDLNQQLSLPVSFLGAKPFFQGVQNNSQSLSASTNTPITLDTEVSDPWNMHSNPVDSSQVTVPAEAAGIWLVQGQIPYAAPAANNRYTALAFKNGSPYTLGDQLSSATGGGGIPITPSYMDLMNLNAGDTVQLAGWVDTTGGASTSPSAVVAPFTDATLPTLTMRWVASNGVGATGGLTPPNITSFFQNPVASSDFNNYIANSVRFLSYVPYCRVTTGGGQSIPNGTNTTITGMTATFDNYSSWNASTNTWTCQVPGIYLLFGQVGFNLQASAYTSNALLSVTSGGNVTYIGNKYFGIAPVSSVKRRFRLNAGDTVQLVAFQSFGSAQNTTGATRLFTLWQSR